MAPSFAAVRRRLWHLARRGLVVGLVLVAAGLLVTVALVLPWRWLDPPGSSVILQARWRGEVAASGRLEHRWLDLEAMGDWLPLAVVAAEDQRFPEHSGFDLAEIRKALDGSRSRPRGASTLTQQVARNLFLWLDRSWLRKGAEAWLTVWIEALWPKRRILEIYLNIAEMGPGLYGSAAASEAWFGVSPDRLDAARSARLAAILPNPKSWSPVRPSAWVLRRAAWIEGQMRQLGGPAYLEGLRSGSSPAGVLRSPPISKPRPAR